ncbi:hypothetical protein NQ095_19970 [Rossellomorea sp. SC111]|nr:hypothetical protein [Rossellomorea sp. SC111]MCR8850704.1 hypothetical protein [Rossellomorea sp. SC111]
MDCFDVRSLRGVAALRAGPGSTDSDHGDVGAVSTAYTGEDVDFCQGVGS